LKALILAAGRGTRLSTTLNGKNKCLTIAQDKPIIGHALDKLCTLKEIESFVIVVGYKAEAIIDYCGHEYKRKKIIYVFQENLNGLVNAIECAKDNIGEDDFLLHLGDEYFVEPDYSKMLEKFYSEKCFSLIGTVRVNNLNLIQKTYTFSYNLRGEVCNLIEKPIQAYNNFMGTGNVIFKAGIIDYIQQTPINQMRGERDLTDLIKTCIMAGKKVKYFVLSKKYVNLNVPEDMKNL
jgi:dTDP-glucose pyrophosphorylase